MKKANVYARKIGSTKGPFQLTHVIVIKVISDDEFLGRVATEEVTYRFTKDAQGVYNPTAA